MFPSLFYWAPVLKFPFSGNVSQDIEPDWFFSGIKPEAGDAKLEKQIFDHASYGKQLGIVIDALASMLDADQNGTQVNSEAKTKLLTLQTDIEKLKAVSPSKTDDLISQLNELKANKPEDFANICESILA